MLRVNDQIVPNADSDSLPMDGDAVSSRRVFVQPTGGLGVVEQNRQYEFHAPVVSDSYLDIEKTRYQCSFDVTILDRGYQFAGADANINGVSNSDCIAVQMAALSGHMKWDIILNKTIVNSFNKVQPRFSPITQGLYTLVSNEKYRPWGKASLEPFNQKVVLPATYAAGDYGVSSNLQLVIDESPMTNFAELCLNVSGFFGSLPFALSDDGARCIDKGFLYRCGLLKQLNSIDITYPRGGIPPQQDKQTYATRLTMYGRPPIPFLHNEYKWDASIPLTIIGTMGRTVDMVRGLVDGAPSPVAQVKLTYSKMEMIYHMVQLKPAALLSMRETVRKGYWFEGVSTSTFPITNSSGLAFTLPNTARTPKAVFWAYLRNALYSDVDVPVSGGSSGLSEGQWGYSDFLRSGNFSKFSNLDAYNQLRFTENSVNIELNGVSKTNNGQVRSVFQVNPANQVTNYAATGNTVVGPLAPTTQAAQTGEAGTGDFLFESFRETLKNPSSISYDQYLDLGFRGISLINVGDLWNTQQDLISSEVTFNLGFTVTNTDNVNLSDYTLAVFSIYDRMALCNGSGTTCNISIQG